MKYDNTMPALLRAAREAEAVRDWLREVGEDLASAAYLFGGAECALQACHVVASVRDGEDLSSLLPPLRDLRDLLVTAVWDSDLPIVILEGGTYVRCDPNHPEISNAQVWAEVLDQGVQALDTAARNREVKFGQDGRAA